MKMSQYEELSNKRKQGQIDGTVPDWMSTGGFQMFEQKYLYEAANPYEQYMRIAATAAKHAPDEVSPADAHKYGTFNDDGTPDYGSIMPAAYWQNKFFEVLWKGWVACSTPVLANMGTNRGCTVSCAGSVVGDSVRGFYDNYREVALLTKEGFGTASDLSGVRCRGSRISKGGKASGVMPVIQHHIQDMRDVAQGTARRGAWAAYLNIEHGDFWEVIQYLEKNPDDFNIGWIISDAYIAKLKKKDKEATRRFKRAMKVKMIFGKGYFFFIDKVNRNRPEMYKDLGFMVKASQLCTEIFLHSDETKYTYTCVLAWMNLSKADEWKHTDAVFVATVFLDCVVSEFIEQASKIQGLEKAVAATKAGRAIGLGAGGYHTYLQEHDMPFESIDAHMFNVTIFKHINKQSLEASKWLAIELGEPEWCKGYGLRFTHRMAVAPTKSTALIYGGISEGINPDAAMCFTQKTSAGDVDRVNAPLLALIKRKGSDIEKCIADVVQGYGSVQHVDWLTVDEKEVFKTAFEINQRVILREAAARQPEIDQGQSINLFISKDAKEREIAAIHQEAFLNENIHSLYYVYSSRAVVSSSSECVSCQ
jgi:ribonucleoside-diphosphate reductase alpha chain